MIVIHSLSSGGAERVSANLANCWVEKGREVSIVTMTSAGNDFYVLHPEVQRIGLGLAGESRTLPAAVWNNVRRVLGLHRLLKRMRPDICLAMMTTSNIQLALARTGLDKTICIGSERIHPPKESVGVLWERLRKHLYGNLDALVALTGDSAEWLRKFTGAKLVKVIPNSVALPLAMHEPVLSLPKEHEGKRVLLSVGRLSAQKNFELLVRVFARMSGDFPDWLLVIIGEGPERKSLEAQVGFYGLEDKVLLPGRSGNMGYWYALADLYVMTSRYEGFPNTLVEALAYGVPAVSFDCATGPADIIRNGIDGLLVADGDEDAIGTALRTMMLDNGLRRAMAERALEAGERFSPERIASMWEELFVELDTHGAGLAG